MPSDGRQPDPETRRALEALVAAAGRAFAEHGWRGTSLNRLLAETGVAKSVFYYHFPNKAALFAAVVERHLAELAQVAPFPDAAVLRQDFWGAVGAWLDALLEALAASPSLLRTIGTYFTIPPSEQRALEPLLHRLAEGVAEILRIGQEVGAVRTDLPLPVLVALVHAVGQELDRWFAAEDGDPSQPWAERYLDTFRRLLAPAPFPEEA